MIALDNLEPGDAIKVSGERHTVVSVFKPRLDPDAIYVSVKSDSGVESQIIGYRWSMTEAWHDPNPNHLSDNFAELAKVRGQEDAIEAYDAEWWTNEMQFDSVYNMNLRFNCADLAGLEVAYPISGDTIAAIRATA